MRGRLASAPLLCAALAVAPTPAAGQRQPPPSLSQAPPFVHQPAKPTQQQRWKQQVDALSTPYLLALYQGNYAALRREAERVLNSGEKENATARCLAYLMRADACRVLRDPKAFAASAAGYRREAARLPTGHPLKGRGASLSSYHQPGIAVRSGFVLPADALRARGVDPQALDAFVRAADRARTDALVVLKGGEVVAEKYFGSYQSPMGLMSVTKPFLCLAVGALLDEGKIRSLDQPVGDFFAEWRKAPYDKITLRHLLTHTSGLATGVTEGDAEADPIAQIRQMQEMNRDLVRYALSQPVMAPPGTTFAYNNLALHLLSGVVQRAAGMPTHRYIAARFFKPMGVTEYGWQGDEAGHTRGADGLVMRAHDLAKFGQLVLDQGMWQGKRLLSAGFVDAMLTDQFHGAGAPLAAMGRDAKTPALGLVWWLRTTPRVVFNARIERAWRDAGVPEAQVAKMLPYRDKVLPRAEYEALITRLFGLQNLNDAAGCKAALGVVVALCDDAPPALHAFEHSGSYGQYLIVYPGSRLVVVRQTRQVTLANVAGDSAAPSAEFPDIHAYIDRLAGTLKP
jgi:Beta-lactamase class C and other penicillin binding proteins